MDTTLESILLNRRIRIGIINFYFEYLAKMASKTNILPVYTDWGNYLTLGENFAQNANRYAELIRFQKFKTLFIPVCDDNHWILIEWDVLGSKAYIYNSILSCPLDEKVEEKYVQAINSIYKVIVGFT